ncbi:S8 family peptidase [Streptomyces sp. NRRL S-1022]|uniref:S8 family peptidase n=1 Tax=Streptomyces sp. NRRL S-1022 TaxID=1463880 RepID=UPI000AC4E4F7|nr:S8 family serine peptidase [Streptomyces sp. NRRL S-1022]
MNKPLWTTVVTAVMAVSLGAVPAQAATPPSAAATAATADPVDPPLYDETSAGGTVRVNVVTANRTDLSSAASAGETVQSYQTMPVVTLKVDRSGLDKLSAQPGVVSVTEDVPARPSLDESVPIIGADQASAQGMTGAGSVVAVLDTGVATGHPFLKDRVVAEACFSPVDPDYGATSLCPDGTDHQEGPGTADSGTGPCAAIAECDHGTHVAGIVAGNGAGLTGAPKRGVAPGANLVAIQVFSKFDSEDVCGPGAAPCVLSFTSAQLAGLEKVLQLRQSGTPLVAANLSLGAGRYATACDTDPRKAAIDNLFAAGVATVVAAGNNGYTDAVSAPACVPSAIAVGATTDDDQLSAFTNRGPLLDLLAPGTSIVSSVPGNGYASKNGTSMAAPHVSGALAILRQAFPDDSIANLQSRLKNSGKSISYTGADTPRINVAQALGGDTAQPLAAGNDFNCDKKEDLAVADPEATVGGDAKAGLVRVVYGAGKGTAELNQDLASVPGDAEPNDYFGDSLAAVDYNKDGCTDLVVGTSREDVGSATDAGTVDVLYGASGGLGSGKAALHLEQGTGSEAILASASEAGDRMGAAVAAGLTLDQEPYLVIGVPGEDIDGKTDTGAVFYLRGSVNRTLIQGSSGVAGTLEAGDKYGSSVAASPECVVVGIPGEGVVPYTTPNGSEVVSGQVDVMAHELNSSGVPTHLASVDQASPNISGEAEAGDQFGASVSATQAMFTQGFPWLRRGTYIAVGIPGEDITYSGQAKADAGRAIVLRVDRLVSPPVTEINGSYEQAPDDVSGAPEAGDRMGAQVAVANRDPAASATDTSLVMAVGVPGEDIGTVADAGAVQVFGLRSTTPGATDRWVEAGNSHGMPGTPTAGHNVGASLYGTQSSLYIGMPYGPGAYGSLYSMPWANVTGGTVQPVTTYAPGTGGLPAAGLRFGMSAR